MSELYVVATPIGNLEDLSPRMAASLTNCDLIVAEDTRVTMKLLHHLDIRKPMISLDRHAEAQKSPAIVERMLREDLTVCLTCDAGTPGISDPGVPLVHAAIEAGIRVIPVCGPSAVITHLSACGFDTRSFGFYGFLPREHSSLLKTLKQIGKTGLNTVVFYESPHRVTELVETIGEAFPECQVSVACDLSKLYESILTGPWQNVLDRMKANPNTEKGEYSVAVELPPLQEEQEAPVLTPEVFLLKCLYEGCSLQEASDKAMEAGLPRNKVYKAKLDIRTFLERSASQI